MYHVAKSLRMYHLGNLLNYLDQKCFSKGNFHDNGQKLQNNFRSKLLKAWLTNLCLWISKVEQVAKYIFKSRQPAHTVCVAICALLGRSDNKKFSGRLLRYTVFAGLRCLWNCVLSSNLNSTFTSKGLWEPSENYDTWRNICGLWNASWYFWHNETP